MNSVDNPLVRGVRLLRPESSNTGYTEVLVP
jgi:hypothetical protein